jgi:hypothetical protein
MGCFAPGELQNHVVAGRQYDRDRRLFGSLNSGRDHTDCQAGEDNPQQRCTLGEAGFHFFAASVSMKTVSGSKSKPIPFLRQKHSELVLHG